MPLLEFLLFIKSETRLTKYFSSFHRKWKHLCRNLCNTRWSQRGLGKGWATGRSTPLGRSECSNREKREEWEREERQENCFIVKTINPIWPRVGTYFAPWHVITYIYNIRYAIYWYIRANTCTSLLNKFDFPNFLNPVENGHSTTNHCQRELEP